MGLASLQLFHEPALPWSSRGQDACIGMGRDGKELLLCCFALNRVYVYSDGRKPAGAACVAC